MLKVVSWESIRKDRFSLTPHALFDELARNTQFILSNWHGDATRRQERLRAPLEECEDEKGDEEENAEAEEEKLRYADKYGLDIDSDFRTKKFKSRFRNWEDVAKAATEIVLDEMRTLLESLDRFKIVQLVCNMLSPPFAC